MKKVVFLICLSFLSSCEKYPFLPDKYSQNIFGTWQWEWTACYFGGYYLRADTAGYTVKITFDRNGNYHKYRNDTLKLSSKYSLELSDSYNDYHIYKLTIEKEDMDYRALLSADTLLLSPFDMYDACEDGYQRQ